MGKEANGSAKDRQRTDAQRRGTAKLRQATNGDGADALRNERRWQGDALLRYGEAKPRHATAMDRYGQRRRCFEEQGLAKAKRSVARRRQSSSEICRATALKCNITRRRSPARQRKGEAEHSGVRDGKAKQPNAAQGDGEARSRDEMRRPCSASLCDGKEWH